KKFHGAGCEFGYAATPLVEDGLVILPVGGPKAALVALHADDGSVAWTSGSDPASYCPAFPITLKGRRCVVGYMQNSLLIVELATGKPLYQGPLSEGYDEHSAWPLYREPDLMLSSPFRRGALGYRLEFDRNGDVQARPRWASPQMSNDVVSSVLYR